MGTLVFQATLGGSVNLLGPNIASNINFTLPSADGTNGQALTTNGSGVLAFSTVVSAPAGSNTQVQFNNSGAFGASSSLTWNGSVLTSAGFSGPLNGTVGATTANTGNFTTLTTSSTVTLNGGTANGVAYLNGSKVLTSGSALTFNGSSATPILTVTKATPATLSGLNFVYSSATSSILVNDGSGEMQFAAGTNSSGYYQTFLTDGSERMRLTSTGLGIGTSSPLSKLEVFNSAVNGAFVPNTLSTWRVAQIRNDQSGTSGSAAGIAFTGNPATQPAGIVAINGNTTGGVVSLAFLYVAGNSTTEGMRLDSSGNLGIGTTPSAWGAGTSVIDLNTGGSAGAVSSSGTLSIANNGYFNGTNWIYKNSSTALTYQLISGQHRWNIAASGTAGNPITFTQAMTLDASGNLLVGATSGGGQRIYAEAANGTTAIISANNTTNGNASGYSSSLQTGANNTSSYHFYGSTLAVGNWYLYGNGTSSWSSDERLKKNIVTTRDGYLDDVCKLRVVKYQWKNGPQQVELGLIAQEVEQVFPNLVQDDLNQISPDDPILYKQLKGSVLPMILLKAIQELKAEFDAYKASHP